MPRSRRKVTARFVFAAAVLFAAWSAEASVPATGPASGGEAAVAAPSDGLTVSDEKKFELYKEYWDAEQDSQEETAAFAALQAVLPEQHDAFLAAVLPLHRRLMTERLGEEGVRAMRQFDDAPAGSDAEKHAEAELQAVLDRRGVSVRDAMRLYQVDHKLAEGQGAASESVSADDRAAAAAGKTDFVGGEKSLEAPEVAVSLNVSRQRVVAGEPWSVFGMIENRSDQPIWLTDRYTTLVLTPELWGMSSQTGSSGAFLPTSQHDNNVADEVVRVDAKSQYVLVWKIDPFAEYFKDPFDGGGRGPRVGSGIIDAADQLVKRIGLAVSNFLFFVPGSYRISADIHVWTSKPDFQAGHVRNVGDSVAVAVQDQVQVDSSIWVLLLGASLGGLLAFALKSLESSRNARRGWWGILLGPRTFLGAVGAVLLSGIGTILVSRVSSSQFIVSVEVRDFWGAVATGFVMQWVGYSLIARLLPTDGNDEEDKAKAGEEPVKKPGAPLGEPIVVPD